MSLYDQLVYNVAGVVMLVALALRCVKRLIKGGW